MVNHLRETPVVIRVATLRRLLQGTHKQRIKGMIFPIAAEAMAPEIGQFPASSSGLGAASLTARLAPIILRQVVRLYSGHAFKHLFSNSSTGNPARLRSRTCKTALDQVLIETKYLELSRANDVTQGRDAHTCDDLTKTHFNDLKIALCSLLPGEILQFPLPRQGAHTRQGQPWNDCLSPITE